MAALIQRAQRVAKRARRFLQTSRKAVVAFGAVAAALGLDISSGVEAIDAAILAAIVWLTPNGEGKRKPRRRPRAEVSD